MANKIYKEGYKGQKGASASTIAQVEQRLRKKYPSMWNMIKKDVWGSSKKTRKTRKVEKKVKESLGD